MRGGAVALFISRDSLLSCHPVQHSGPVPPVCHGAQWAAMCHMQLNCLTVPSPPTTLPSASGEQRKWRAHLTLSHLANWTHTSILLWSLLCWSAESADRKLVWMLVGAQVTSMCSHGHRSSVKQLWCNVDLQITPSPPSPCLQKRTQWEGLNRGCYELFGKCCLVKWGEGR